MTVELVQLTDQEKAVLTDRLLAWYDSESVDYPWRRDWRRCQSPYHVWLSEIMLQQTTISAVLPKYARFTAKLPDVAAVAKASEEDIRELVQGLGYYRRFALFHKASQYIANRGFWPGSYEEWLEIPGVGPYTAAAIASITLDAARGVVDGNVERVLARVYAIPGPVNAPGKKGVFTTLVNHLIPNDRPGDFNQALMQLGQIICNPGLADCNRCPLEQNCVSRMFQLQVDIPAPKVKKSRLPVHMRVLLQGHEQLLTAYERPAKAKFLRGQTGLPTFIYSAKSDKWILDGDDSVSLDAHKVTPVGQFKHSITHHDLVVEVVRLAKEVRIPNALMLPTHDLAKKFIASLDLKALKTANL